MYTCTGHTQHTVKPFPRPNSSQPNSISSLKPSLSLWSGNVHVVILAQLLGGPPPFAIYTTTTTCTCTCIIILHYYHYTYLGHLFIEGQFGLAVQTLQVNPANPVHTHPIEYYGTAQVYLQTRAKRLTQYRPAYRWVLCLTCPL